jgi:hypothetical protein
MSAAEIIEQIKTLPPGELEAAREVSEPVFLSVAQVEELHTP